MTKNKRQNQSNPSGLRLDAPALDAPTPSAAAQFFYAFPLLFSGAFSAVWCFLSAFEVSLHWGWLLGCTAATAALTSFLLLKRHKITYLLGLSLLWTVLVILLRDSFVQGFIRMVNYVSRSYSKASGMHLTVFVVPSASPQTAANQITLFCALFLILLLLLFGWLLLCQRWYFICFVLTVPFLAVPLAYTILPNYLACGLLLVFWACLLCTHSGMGRKRGFRKQYNGYAAAGMDGGSAAVFLYPSLAALLLLLFFAFPPQSYTRPQILDSLRSTLVNSFTNLTKSSTGSVGNSNERVDLQALDKLEYHGTEVLQVSTNLVAPLYLKNFAGSIYTGSSWERAPQGDYEAFGAQGLRYNPQNYAFYSSRYSPSSQLGTLTVRNVGGNPKNIYAPYSLGDLPGGSNDFQFVQDSFLESPHAFGTQEYSMNVSILGSNALNRLDRLVEVAAQEEISMSNWSEYIDWERFFNAEPGEEISALYTTGIPSPILDLFRPDIADFFKEEQEYSRYVYDHYRQLPDDLRAKLEQYCSVQGYSNRPTLTEQIEEIAADITQSGSYTLSPPKTPAGRDFVDYFLFESHQGYCVHFASAAVAVLRAQGIPARYAEGYTVSPDDFYSMQNGWISVRDYRAHAWVEVYYPGYGWAPVDVTPGYSNGHTPAEEAQASSSEPESSLPSSSEPESSRTPSSEAPSSLPPASSAEGADAPVQEGGNAQPVLFVFLIVAAGIALLFLLLLTRRRVRRLMREKQFLQKNQNQAALSVYRYVQRLIRAAAPALELTGEMPQELEELVLRARFSQHKLKTDEVKSLIQYAESLQAKIKEKLPPARRFWLAYIAALL